VPAELGVIVTARDEADRLGETLAALRGAFAGARIVVADDASEDGTADVAAAGGAEVVRARRRLGKGGAATLAARRVLEDPDHRPRMVLLADADLGASAASLTELVAALEREDGDLIVADFETRAGGGLGLALAAARTVIARRTGGLRPRAPLSGQRALRADDLAALLPFARGFGMETAMTIDAHRAGLRVAEVALPLEHRVTRRDLAGFLHRGGQLADVLRVVRRP
jgi:glycosyltransferase involved in cell wall biosynthesis